MTINDLEYLGTALAVLRRRTGKMQKEISIETGMSRSQVSRYERGRDTPNLVTLVKYLTTIGSDFRDLHDAIQEVKALKGFTDPGKPVGAAAFERTMTNRLPLAPELRNALYELLEPVFLEIEDIKQTLSVLQELVTPEDTLGDTSDVDVPGDEPGDVPGDEPGDVPGDDPGPES